MERNEPALAPEWLRSPGSISGGGISAQQSASSSSFADSQAHYSRNRTSKSISDIDKPHIDFLDRSASSNSRRSASNGAGKNAYSSFNRNHRDRDREKEKESSSFRDPRGHDFSGPSVNIFSSRVEKETLRRSHSMVSRKQDELFPQRVASDSRSGVYNHKTNSNNLQSGSNINGITNKAVFDKNFPSLGFEEIQGGPDVGRVSSPGLSAAVQSLHIGNSTLNGREGWTSALADAPTIITNTSAAPSPVQQMAANSGLGSPNAATALKMAEALSQASSRARVAPQTTEIQRLEELAIKQSRQLIPVTPSMPKVSSKSASRSGELHTSAKVGQQQLTLVQHNNQPFRGGQVVKSDSPKTSHGKFHVLKPGWENGVSPAALKDSSSLTNNVNNQTANCQPSVSSPSTPAALRNPNNLNTSSSLNRKVAALDLKSGSTLEKRPSTQLQSRNDFFNLIKKKTSVNGSSCARDSGILASPMMEKSGIVTRETVGAAVHPYTETDGHEVSSNGNTTEEVQRFSEAVNKSLTPTIAVCPDEEEVAFLRSLGWEENSGEEEGLTEEEINAFYQQYMKLKPSLKQIQSPKPANAV